MKMNRREFIGAVAGGVLAVGYGYDPESAAARERESLARRVQEYQIIFDDAPNPEMYADEFMKRLKKALTNECTPENVEAWAERTSALSGDLQIDMMNDFDPAIVAGLFGFSIDKGLSEILNSPEYRILSAAHRGITTHYLDYLARSGESEQFTFSEQGSNVTSSDDTIYGLSIDLFVTNNLQDDDPHKVALDGTIRLGVEPEVRGDGVYRSNLGVSHNGAALFQDLADLG